MTRPTTKAGAWINDQTKCRCGCTMRVHQLKPKEPQHYRYAVWCSSCKQNCYFNHHAALLAAHIPRAFQLVRREDESGVSGTGVVAVGVQFPSGCVVMEWLVAGQTMGTYYPREIDDEMMGGSELVEMIHGHDGKTVIEWID